ncbi:MAG: bifunctional oligoribonuclease/PAP phosphatase NrnA [bacterium]
MTKPNFDPISNALRDARTVAVASHIRPDADALGSTIAFALWLRDCGKQVTAYNEEGATAKFRYLPAHDIVTMPPETPQQFDVFVALDTSVKNRLGTVLKAIAPGTPILNIDHHISNENFGDVNYIDPSAPATGQILAEFFQHVGARISSGMATNLFAAISTDTGSFQYAGTSERTFAVASQLIRCGVDVPGLSRAMYDSQPRRRFELLRHALNTAEFHCDDRIATFSLPLALVEKLQVLPEDNEGIIDHLRSVEGVEAAVFFEELPDGKVRVSARSKFPRIDVCKVCKTFDGGGHPMAAGARVDGPLDQVKTDFLKALSDEIRN